MLTAAQLTPTTSPLSLKVHNDTPTLWQEFCQSPRTLDDLIDQSHRWLEMVSGFSINYLHKGKNRLGKRSEKGSPAAWFNSGYSTDGVPFVRLTFSTFRHGGESESFDNQAALLNLYEQYGLSTKKKKGVSALSGRKDQAVESSGRFSTDESKDTLLERELQQKIKDEELARKKAKSIANDLNLWASLATTGMSTYLKRKGVAEVARGTESIRYGTGFIAALICDIDCAAKGIQKIYDDGSKLFTYGLEKKGSFILLGTINEKHPSFFVVEGLATGLTIFQATRGTTPVICALDAGNLAPVIEALRKKYGTKSQCPIIIAADNDQWKAANLDSQTKNPIGNTGMIKSHQAAMKHRCLVVSPNFDGLDISNLPTDFNDLHQIADILEVAAQLAKPQKPQPQHAFFKTRTKQTKQARKLFSYQKMIQSNNYFLSKNLLDAITEYETIIVRSPIGTGKTELVKRAVEEMDYSESVLYVSHLVSLATDAAKRLDLELYSDYKGQKLNDSTEATLNEVNHIAICLNSLPMLCNNGKARRFDVVIIDEIEQLLRRCTTKIKNKKLVLEILRHVISSANKVIVLDAHMSSLTLQMLELWRQGRKTVTILNEHQIGQGRAVTLYESDAEVMQAALKELRENGTVFLTCNSKDTARATFKLLEKEAPGKHGLYISADNSGDLKTLAFFEDVNSESKKYDFIVCSPSVSTGVSINNNHFSFVGGIFTHAVNTPMDCIQALGRVRNTINVHVYASDSKNSFATNTDEIAAKWMKTHTFDKKLMGIGFAGNLEILSAEYHKLFLAVEREQNFARNDFLYRFLQLLDADGYTIDYKTLDETEATIAEMLKDDAKKLEQQEYVETRVLAKNLTNEEAKNIGNKHRRTFEETRALDKYEIKEFYKMDDNLLAEDLKTIIEQDKRGKTREQVKVLEIAHATDAQLAELHAKQNETTDFLPDKRNFAAERELSIEVLNSVGINHTSLESDGRIYTKDHPAITALIAWLVANRSWLCGVYRIPSDEMLTKDPLRFVSRFLRRMGLKQLRTGRTTKGQYCVDSKQLSNMRKILVYRGTLE